MQAGSEKLALPTLCISLELDLLPDSVPSVDSQTGTRSERIKGLASSLFCGFRGTCYRTFITKSDTQTSQTTLLS